MASSSAKMACLVVITIMGWAQAAGLNKFLAGRSLAASGVPDPHCTTGVISLKVDGKPQSCCPRYCGVCGDYESCKNVRGQASENACCASKVYENRCGNAPANICIETCSQAVPPCIMDINASTYAPDKAEVANPAPKDYVNHATHAVEIAADRNDLGIQKGKVLANVYSKVEKVYAKAEAIGKQVIAKCNKRLADFENYAKSHEAKKFSEGDSPKEFYEKVLKDVDARLKTIPNGLADAATFKKEVNAVRTDGQMKGSEMKQFSAPGQALADAAMLALKGLQGLAEKDMAWEEDVDEFHEPAIEKLHQQALGAFALSGYEQERAEAKGNKTEEAQEKAQEKKADHALEDIVGKIKSAGKESMTDSEKDFEDLQEVLSEGDTAEMVSADAAAENNALVTANDLARVHGGKHAEDKGTDGTVDTEGGDMGLPPGPDEGLALWQRVGNAANATISGDSIALQYTRWAGARVPYCFAPDVSEHVKHIMLAAMNQYKNAVPCLDFVDVGWKSGSSTDPADKQECNEKPAIFVQSNPNSGCWSYIGYIPVEHYIHYGFASQALQMHDPGCVSIGTAAHELGHALGMAHEQSRPDRDDFLKIHMDNVEPGKEHNFKIDPAGYTAVAYDVLSVMHYDGFAFAKDAKKPTMEFKSHPGDEVGQRVGLSAHDVEQVEAMYSSESSTCKSNGLAGLGCLNKPDDSGHDICSNITECSSKATEHCCACKGGIKVQCYEGQNCPTVELLPPPPPMNCIEDKTYLFSGYGYPCIYTNVCDFDVVYECPGMPCSHSVRSKAYEAATCNGDWQTLVCSATSTCKMRKA